MQIINTVAAIACLLPLSVLAAPTGEATAPTGEPAAAYAIVERGLSPHRNCYNSGVSFKSIGGMDNAKKIVAAGCAFFAQWSGRTFHIGETVRTCPPPSCPYT